MKTRASVSLAYLPSLRTLVCFVLISLFLDHASSIQAAVAERIQFDAATALDPTSALEEISDDEVGLLQIFPQRIWPVEAKSKSSLIERVGALFGQTPAADDKQPTRPLLAALRRVRGAAEPHDFAAIEEFVKGHPGSKWSASMRSELARRRFQQGMFDRAVATWDLLWDELRDRTEPPAIELANEVIGHLLDANVGLSNSKRLAELIGEQEKRPTNAVIEAKLTRARQGVWLLKHKGAQNVMCGPLALYEILNYKGQPFAPVRLDSITDDYIATGISLAQIARYSEKYGLGMKAARKPPGRAIPTPAIAHLSAGHYVSILTEEAGKYLLADRAMRFKGWVTLATIESQASGAYLINDAALTIDWGAISDSEASSIYGRDGLHGQQDTGGSVTPNSPTTGGNRDDCVGMPTYTFHPQVAALRVQDIPVGYAPPVGPAVYTMIAYNDLDSSKPTSSPPFSNVGIIWSINWIAYVDHVTASLTNGRDLNVHVAGGGFETLNYSVASARFGPHDRSFATVVRTGTATYTRSLPDGSSEVYNTPDNATAPKRVFLTRKIDPHGNALVFAYDSNMRLTTITDAIGQVTTFAYPTTGDIRKVARITDPFGRFATFTYTSSGDLSSVTDVIGLTSRFSYDNKGFMTSMTTPYGTTTFLKVDGDKSWDRSIIATDPQGDKEVVQYVEPVEIPGSEPSLASSYTVGGNTVPFLVESARLQFRNSFYWSKKAFKDAPNDFKAARTYRWLTDDRYNVTPILESVKEPLEGRVWFNYPSIYEDNDFFLFYPGVSGIPNKTLRLLDDGTPQLSQLTHNPLGRPTIVIDPIGRTTTFAYASNQVDLLEIRQRTSATTSDRLALFTYNTQHLPLTATDAAGQTTTYAYNSRGQPTSIANAKNEVTTFAYNASGYLTAVDGPLPGTADTTSFAYDSSGRVRTVTNSDGYAVTFSYDNLDRTTEIVYPDGTKDQFTYTRLDRTGVRDRLGRLTTYTYNSLRQLVQVQDALRRITRFEWCRCGAMRSLIDPLGRLTSWQQDVQGRTVGKTYADGSKVSYIFGASTSRLQQIIDEKGQITTYQYNADNTLRQVSYPNAAIATPTVSLTYDANYNRVITMTDGTGTTAYAYNPVPAAPTPGAGRLASVDGPLTNDTITYQHDQLGRIESRAIGGVAENVTFDAAGRVTATTNVLGAFSYAYEGSTIRLASVSYPNGQTSNYSYFDNAGDRRLRQITHARGAIPISQFSYAHDSVGRITTWTQQADNSPPVSYDLGYDDADQLTSAVLREAGTTRKSFAYSYDPAGNRLREQIDTTTWQFSYNILNELTSTAGAAAASMSYEWDGAGRLSAIVQGANRSEFTYDGLGRRVRIVEKQNSTVVSDRRFIWCGLRICEERDASGTSTAKRFVRQGTKEGSEGYFYTRDHLGSLREVSDSAGALRARYEYDPYGRRTAVSGSVENEMGFSGFHFHPSGLQLAVYRAYDPTLGRWISRDPIHESGGVNMYAYVGSNPVNSRDPLGLAPNLRDLIEQAVDYLNEEYTLEVLKKTSGSEGMSKVEEFDLRALFGIVYERFSTGKGLKEVCRPALAKAAGGILIDTVANWAIGTGLKGWTDFQGNHVPGVFDNWPLDEKGRIYTGNDPLDVLRFCPQPDRTNVQVAQCIRDHLPTPTARDPLLRLRQ